MLLIEADTMAREIDKICTECCDGGCRWCDCCPVGEILNALNRRNVKYFRRESKDVLVVHFDTLLKKEDLKARREEILKEMQTGLVTLRPSEDAFPAPAEVLFMDKDGGEA